MLFFVKGSIKLFFQSLRAFYSDEPLSLWLASLLRLIYSCPDKITKIDQNVISKIKLSMWLLYKSKISYFFIKLGLLGKNIVLLNVM